jgi:hypothetical protein
MGGALLLVMPPTANVLESFACHGKPFRQRLLSFPTASLLLLESFASDSKPFQQHLFSFLAAAPPTAHHSDACCAAADLRLEPFAAHGKAVPILSFPRAALPPKRVNMYEGVYSCIYIYIY